MRQHITPEGDIKPCRAVKNNCRYSQHFNSEEAALEYLIAKEEKFPKLSKEQLLAKVKAKYPRTPHLPFSRSHTSDDILGENWDFLSHNLEVIVTEKMDGENTTFYSDKFHARSMDSQFHPSRSWVAGLWGNISYKIPEHRRIILENVYAEHSIRYDELPTFAFGIGVVDLLDGEGKPSLSGKATFLGWDDTQEVFDDLGITPVPQLYQGKTSLKHLEGIFKGLDKEHQEGIVVRTFDKFSEEDFEKNVGKAVRKGHVQTDDKHWTKTWRPNAMKK